MNLVNAELIHQAAAREKVAYYTWIKAAERSAHDTEDEAVEHAAYELWLEARSTLDELLTSVDIF